MLPRRYSATPAASSCRYDVSPLDMPRRCRRCYDARYAAAFCAIERAAAMPLT